MYIWPTDERTIHTKEAILAAISKILLFSLYLEFDRSFVALIHFDDHGDVNSLAI